MPVMRAKLVVNSVQKLGDKEILNMSAVAKNTAYPDDGSDEDNTFAKFSPSASFTIHVANPNLHGKFVAGQKYYADFTLAE